MMFRFARYQRIAIATAMALAAGAAHAHHSFAMFDKSKTVDIEGTLHAVEWKNPHAWIWIMAKDASGKPQLYGLEGGSPAALTREGYTKSNLTVGTKVIAQMNPLRDGRPGGALVKLSFPDKK